MGSGNSAEKKKKTTKAKLQAANAFKSGNLEPDEDGLSRSRNSWRRS